MNFRFIRKFLKECSIYKKVLYFLDGLSIFIAQSKDLRIHRGFRKSSDQSRDMSCQMLTEFIFIRQVRSFGGKASVLVM